TRLAMGAAVLSTVQSPRGACWLLLALATLVPAGASAQAGSPPDAARLFVEGVLGGSLHREGALLDLRLRYRHRLYAAADEALRDNYAGAGVIAQTSPAFNQTGAYAELAPASFFRLTAAYQAVAYFGTFDSLR